MLLNRVAFQELSFIPSLNTGSLLDIGTGTFVPGVSGNMVLDGGITFGTSVLGRNGLFKSATIIGDFVNAWARLPGADLIVHDVERHQNEERVLGMSDVTPHPKNELNIIAGIENTAESVFNTIEAIVKERVKHKKDYMVETPFLDQKTGKPKTMMVPILLIEDSWTEMRTQLYIDIMDGKVKLNDDGTIQSKGEISDPAKNTVAMREGLVKSRLSREYARLAEYGNLYVGATAHVVDKGIENPMMPSAKDNQYMKQSEKIKGVGKDFMFLMTTVLECRKARVMDDGSRNVLYPTKEGLIAPTDLNEVSQLITRGKVRGSGGQLNRVYSQAYGLNKGLTDYHYLRDGMKYWGMKGNPQNHQCALYPEQNLSRTTINDLTYNDPKLRRALEITAQLCFIRHNWTMRSAPVPFTITPQALFEKLQQTTNVADDILTSRGWWTYTLPGEQPNSQPYLSLWDILSIAEGKYKPKHISVKTPSSSKAEEASNSK
jgi:hypothetical protein